MSAKQFAAQMKVTIEEIKAQGTTAIACDNLIAYLDEIQKSPEAEPSAVEIEKYKADLQNWIEANKRNHEGQLEMFRSVISSGQGAIKSSFLLNGGASVAMLAFIGHLAQFKPEKVSAFCSLSSSVCLWRFGHCRYIWPYLFVAVVLFKQSAISEKSWIWSQHGMHRPRLFFVWLLHVGAA